MTSRGGEVYLLYRYRYDGRWGGKVAVVEVGWSSVEQAVLKCVWGGRTL